MGWVWIFSGTIHCNLIQYLTRSVLLHTGYLILSYLCWSRCPQQKLYHHAFYAACCIIIKGLMNNLFYIMFFSFLCFCVWYKCLIMIIYKTKENEILTKDTIKITRVVKLLLEKWIERGSIFNTWSETNVTWCEKIVSMWFELWAQKQWLVEKQSICLKFSAHTQITWQFFWDHVTFFSISCVKNQTTSNSNF